jgi:Ca-activated chloride channel family protein
MSLQWPLMLLGLLAVPVIVWAALRRRGRNAAPVAALMALGLTLLVGAAARPHATVSLPRVEGTVILAVDNSNSMLAEDAEPTRIAAAQAIARDLVDAQPGTVNVGVVSFSSGGAVLQEATTRHELALDTIDRLTPDGGTSLAQGLFTSLSAVTGEPIAITQEAIDAGDVTLLDLGWHAGAVVVVFSDGENRAGLDPHDVAELAANSGIRIFTVGVGATDGTTLAIDGFTLATALNEQTLVEIAEVSGGQYFAAANGVDLEAVSDAIDLELTFRGEPSEITALVAIAGLALLLAGAALSLHWFGRIA